MDEGAKNADMVGRDEAQRILHNYVQPPMDVDTRGALDDFVAKKRLEYQT